MDKWSSRTENYPTGYGGPRTDGTRTDVVITNANFDAARAALKRAKYKAKCGESTEFVRWAYSCSAMDKGDFSIKDLIVDGSGKGKINYHIKVVESLSSIGTATTTTATTTTTAVSTSFTSAAAAAASSSSSSGTMSAAGTTTTATAATSVS
jgi:hypothetical protein